MTGTGSSDRPPNPRATTSPIPAAAFFGKKKLPFPASASKTHSDLLGLEARLATVCLTCSLAIAGLSPALDPRSLCDGSVWALDLDLLGLGSGLVSASD